MSQWHGGKGSTPRATDQKKYSDNWDKIFANKQEQQHDKSKETESETSKTPSQSQR